ncbi:MAG: HTH-type transcriptional regulator CymR [Syntrophus sp. PtaU1.Bin005]|jgi:Rrf2 family protein|uniref:RrF2 family transcriptional regulator n=1 Tax=Syntrophus TaxID=43773 RepID=UPI0009C4D3F6|nr:MAG: HTH-type transcriptional regulator CymR [Syntrophus sp. PtaB.Bin138]OPY80730.1 MAG: HTH-type transcriptional regulator CymR [Syntrophus sp. PtaU1.Bin005]
MKLSTRGRYGLRFMLDLALHYNQGPIFLKDIAQRQGISEKYLWHLIHPLKAGGLIRSNRGAHGGYFLAKAPSEINLKEIMQSVEGSLALVDCVDNDSVCQRAQTCITRDIWQEATRVMLHTLESLTLDAMVKRQTEKEEQVK